MKKLWMLTIGLLLIGLILRPLPTVADSFTDVEISTSNTIAVGTLDVSLRDTANNPITTWLNVSDLEPGNSIMDTFRVYQDGSNNFQYSLQFNQTGGSATFCSTLQLDAAVDGVPQYSGSLSSFNYSPVLLSGTYDDWSVVIDFSDRDPSLFNQTCQFDLLVNAWQTDSDGTWGFVDSELISNTISSGTWTTIVINELMWMGSEGDSDDEWIELRNTLNQAVDISGWQLTSLVGAGNTETLMLTIPASTSIAANGFYLISNYNEAGSAMSVTPDLVDTSVVLRNTDLQIKLYQGDWTVVSNLIDTADDGSGAPLAGMNVATKISMERNDNPATGWHSCIDIACNDTTYWDVEGNNYGTPKAPNLSDNDPSIPQVQPPPPYLPPAPPDVLLPPTYTISLD